jgi:hypothetical protein
MNPNKKGSRNHPTPTDLTGTPARCEDTKRQPTQVEVLKEYFRLNVGTRKMASDATGIYRANICRYVAEMKGKTSIRIVKKDFCKVTKAKAEYLTLQKPTHIQTKLFSNDNR